MTARRHRHNGKPDLDNWTVTVTVYHYIQVRATDTSDALRRAAIVAANTYGLGRNVRPVEAFQGDTP